MGPDATILVLSFLNAETFFFFLLENNCFTILYWPLPRVRLWGTGDTPPPLPKPGLETRTGPGSLGAEESASVTRGLVPEVKPGVLSVEGTPPAWQLSGLSPSAPC